LAFADAQVDIAVFEVGLGGRLDATNAIPHATSLITRIAMDHEAFLGNSITAIAQEKADIIAHHCPVVVGPQAPEALAVIRTVAAERGATLLPAVPYPVLPAGLPPYQQENIGIAQTAADLLHVPRTAFNQALATFAWPGRYQWRPGRPALLLDGAHNASGIQAFVEAVRADPRCGDRPMVGIFSAVHGKEIGGMVNALRSLNIPWFVCPTRSGRTRSTDELAAVLPQAQACASVPEALAAAQRAVGHEGVVAAVGSLFLVADVLGEVTGAAREATIDG
jgi:dihydrofolate synthase/folylpolyglutamate synthase